MALTGLKVIEASYPLPIFTANMITDDILLVRRPRTWTFRWINPCR
jgi:hypothetical protein